jgi:hypothetical protein
MRTLILNSTNIVENTNNSVFEYSFPAGNVTFKKGSKAALASVQMYYSTFNLTAANGNNTFTYTWIDATVVTVTFPDGFYDVDGINDYLHSVMVTNGHYLVSVSTGDYYYFINFNTNANRYAIQVDFFPIGQDLYATPSAYTIPTGTSTLWTNPSAGANEKTPTITIPATNFRNVIGFAAGTFGTQATGTATSLSVLSTTVPQVTPLSSFVITCSLLQNNYAVPNSLLYSFSPQGTFGDQFTIAPNQYSFIDIQGGIYNTFRIQFLDQDLKPVIIEDPQMVILIVIADLENTNI